MVVLTSLETEASTPAPVDNHSPILQFPGAARIATRTSNGVFWGLALAGYSARHLCMPVYRSVDSAVHGGDLFAVSLSICCERVTHDGPGVRSLCEWRRDQHQRQHRHHAGGLIAVSLSIWCERVTHDGLTTMEATFCFLKKGRQMLCVTMRQS